MNRGVKRVGGEREGKSLVYTSSQLANHEAQCPSRVFDRKSLYTREQEERGSIDGIYDPTRVQIDTRPRLWIQLVRAEESV